MDYIKYLYIKYTVLALLVMVALLACNQTTNDNDPQPKLSNDTEVPVISLAASDTNFRSPGTLILTATVTDNEGVRGVEFFEGDVLSDIRAPSLEALQDNKIGEATTAPFALELPIENGRDIVRTFRARATDEAGNEGSSLAVTVAINIELGSLSIRTFAGGNTVTFTPEIVVTGPNSFQKTISDRDSFLSDLELGTYTLTPNDVIGFDNSVNVILEAETTTLELSTSTTFANTDITYSFRPDTGKLWLPVRGDHKLVAVSPGSLGSSFPANAAIAIGTGAASGPNAIAFDATGNLWATDSDTASVIMFTPEQLAGSGTPTPTVMIDGAGFLEGAVGLAFDGDGNLWVASSATNSVVRYTADQLSSSGAPVPAVLPQLVRPFGVAFDLAGNLWISNRDANTVVMFLKADLDSLDNTSVSIVSAAVTLTTGSLPKGLAFDKDGNLWVANLGSDTLTRFPVQGVTSGSVAADITLTDNNGSLTSPTGLAFDNTGKLYVTNVTTKTLAVFETSALVASGSPTARLTSGLGDTDVAMPAFNLPPDTLPLSR
jgi:sugar lactone lactonase YvrE